MVQSIVIAGHSHTLCLGVPLKTQDGMARIVSLDAREPNIIGLSGAFPRDDAYWRSAIEAARTSRVVLLWEGNQHQSKYLFASSPPFDFHSAGLPGLDVASACDLVPETAVRALFDPSLDPLRQLLKRFAEAGAEPPLLCGTPPPKGDNQRLRKLIQSEWHFQQIARDMNVAIETVVLSAPRLRYKLWHVLQSMMAEIATAYGTSFLYVPTHLRTHDGFLGDAYWAEDATHANAAYGQAMRDHIAANLAFA